MMTIDKLLNSPTCDFASGDDGRTRRRQGRILASRRELVAVRVAAGTGLLSSR